MNFFRNTTRMCVGGALIGALALAGCGSSSKSSSSSATTAAGNETTSTVSSSTGTGTSSSGTTVPICGSLSQFKSDLSDLTSVSTLTGGKSGIEDAINKFKGDLDNLKSSLKADDKPKVDAVQNSIKELQTAVGNLKGLSGAGDVASAAKDVGTSAQQLIDALKAGCPSS